jgi:hypothetical protein
MFNPLFLAKDLFETLVIVVDIRLQSAVFTSELSTKVYVNM